MKYLVLMGSLAFLSSCAGQVSGYNAARQDYVTTVHVSASSGVWTHDHMGQQHDRPVGFPPSNRDRPL